MAFAMNEEARDYATWKNERKSKGSFGINVSTGDAVGFSGIPGKATYTFNFGKKIKGQQFKKTKGNPEETPAAVQDGPKPTPKPKPITGKQATTSDVEKAVSAGYITPEEATGGEWGKSAALSTTYSKKSAANAAANGGTNVGKQFTSVRAGQPIPNQSNGAINYDKAPDNRPSNGAVNLDNIK
jgi:hypothetical protein